MEISEKVVEELQLKLKQTVYSNDSILQSVKSKLSELYQRYEAVQQSITRLTEENTALQQQINRLKDDSAGNEELRAYLNFLVKSIEYTASYSEEELLQRIKYAEAELYNVNNFQFQRYYNAQLIELKAYKYKLQDELSESLKQQVLLQASYKVDMYGSYTALFAKGYSPASISSLADCKKLLEAPGGKQHLGRIQYFVSSRGGTAQLTDSSVVLQLEGIQLSARCQ